MPEQLKTLLIDLGEDPNVLERFKQDSESVMQEYGLSEQERELVLSGDKAALKEATGLGDERVDFLIV